MCGYRIYVNAKEKNLLLDILTNDVNFSPCDSEETHNSKIKLINKMLGFTEQTSDKLKYNQVKKARV